MRHLAPVAECGACFGATLAQHADVESVVMRWARAHAPLLPARTRCPSRAACACEIIRVRSVSDLCARMAGAACCAAKRRRRWRYHPRCWPLWRRAKKRR